MSCFANCREVDMRKGPWRPRGVLADALEVLLFLSVSCATALFVGMWSELGGGWESKLVGYVLGTFLFMSIVLLCLQHVLRLLRRTMSEARRTFTRRK